MSNQSTVKKIRIIIALFAVLAFIAVVTVNALANILPLNNVGTGTLSDEIPNLFVPAGLTFSIWGLIYFLLTIYSIFILIQAFRPSGEAWQVMDGMIFILNAAANIGWIFSWHWRNIPLSLAIMLVILFTLIVLHERNYKKFGQGGTLYNSGQVSVFTRLALTVPVNVYLGWISVATIANVTTLLVTMGWDGFGLDPRIWTVVVIAAGLAVALALIFRRNAIAAPLVVVWAYIGIVLKRTTVDSEYSRLIWISAAIAVGIIVVIIAARIVRKFMGKKILVGVKKQ